MGNNTARRWTWNEKKTKHTRTSTEFVFGRMGKRRISFIVSSSYMIDSVRPSAYTNKELKCSWIAENLQFLTWGFLLVGLFSVDQFVRINDSRALVIPHPLAFVLFRSNVKWKRECNFHFIKIKPNGIHSVHFHVRHKTQTVADATAAPLSMQQPHRITATQRRIHFTRCSRLKL